MKPVRGALDRRGFLIAAGTLLLAPAYAQEKREPVRFASALPIPGLALDGIPVSTPEAQGFDSGRLAAMTRYIEGNPERTFSMMIARNGHILYEMLAGDLPRDAAHYMMSVTKSVTSAIAGAAIDRGLIASEDQPIGELLPNELFGSPENLEDKRRITVRQVLNMSALDVPHIVGNTDPEARKNYYAWFEAQNRVRQALGQRKVQRPMDLMYYTDLTCSLMNGIIHYRSRKTALEFGNEHLFSRMGFRNHEWMSQDPSGIELGGYGLRLRPLDMLKFGQLYLQRGTWNGQSLLNPAWIDKAYVSQISLRNYKRRHYMGYSNYWWHGRHRGTPKNIMADGWKGQRISVFPDEKLVVTLSGAIEGDSEAYYEELISRHVLYAMRGNTLPENPAAFGDLLAELGRMREKNLRLDAVESRMRPEARNKEKRKPWRA